MLTDEKIKFLEQQARAVRRAVIESLLAAGSGHTAGSLGLADIFTALYFELLRHNPRDPFWEERDRLVISNGHVAPVLYATLAQAGYFSAEELKLLRRFGSRLQGHPCRERLPGVETSSGPLGEGLAQAVGMALADRLDFGLTSGRFFYCLLGDGELDCGLIWETAMFAAREKLHNLITIIDRNNIQSDGLTEDVLPLEPLREKWESFGWHVQEIDGHNFAAIIEAVGQAKAVFNRPSCILAHTVPGKGVIEFERQFEWHSRSPNREQAAQALKELRTLGGKIKDEHE